MFVKHVMIRNADRLRDAKSVTTFVCTVTKFQGVCHQSSVLYIAFLYMPEVFEKKRMRIRIISVLYLLSCLSERLGAFCRRLRVKCTL
jgi:hypothetical protein